MRGQVLAMAKNTSKKQIIFFHPDLGIGGAERLVVDAAVGLQRRGHRVAIFTSHCDSRHCFDEARDGTLDVRVRGNSIVPPSILNRFSIICAILRQVHLIIQIYLFSSELRQLQPDVFFVDQLSAGIPLLRILSPAARILFYCHFPDKLLAQRQGVLKWLYRVPFDWLESWSTGCSDVIVVNSKFTSSIFAKAFPSLKDRSPEVVYPCVTYDPSHSHINDTVADGNGGEHLWEDKKVILSINRFEKKKETGLAIRAFARIPAEERRSGRLVIAGGYDPRIAENVSYHKELSTLAGGLGLKVATASNLVTAMSIPTDIDIVFLLSVPSSLKSTLLKAARLLAYTPKFEHFGIVPLEAMLAEVPVLAAKTGGPKESVVDGECGWLRDVDHEEEWSEVMKLVLHRLSPLQLQEMGRKGRQRVLAEFTQSSMAERLDVAIEEMTEAQHPLRRKNRATDNHKPTGIITMAEFPVLCQAAILLSTRRIESIVLASARPFGLGAMDRVIGPKAPTSWSPSPLAGRRRKHEQISLDCDNTGSIRRGPSFPSGAEGAALRIELNSPALPGAFPETPARKKIQPQPRTVTVASRRISHNIFVRGFDWISSWFTHSEDSFATKSEDPIPPRPEKRLRLSTPGGELESAPLAKSESEKDNGLQNSSSRTENPTALHGGPSIFSRPIEQWRTPLPTPSPEPSDEVLEKPNTQNNKELLEKVAGDSPCFKYVKHGQLKDSPITSAKSGKGSIARARNVIDILKGTRNSKIQKTQKKNSRLDSAFSTLLQCSSPKQWFELDGPGKQTSLMRERLRAIKTLQSKLRVLYPRMPDKELKHLTLDEMVECFRRPSEEEVEELSRQRERQGKRPIKDLFWVEVEAAFIRLVVDEERHLAQRKLSQPMEEDLENELNKEDSTTSLNATNGLNLVPILSPNRVAPTSAPIFGSSEKTMPQAPPTAPIIDNDLSTLEDAPPAPPVRHIGFAGETSAFVPHTPQHQGIWPTDIKRYDSTSLAGARAYPMDNPSFAHVREFLNCNSPLQDSPETPPRTDVPGMAPNNAYSPASPSKKQNASGSEEADTKLPGNGESPTRSVEALGNELSKLEMFEPRSGWFELEKQSREEAAEEKRRKEKAEREAALRAEQEALERARLEEEARREKEQAEERLEELRKTRIIHALPHDWKTKLDDTMAIKNPARKVAGELSRKDFGTLLPQSLVEGVGWLNDEIVNEFLDIAVKKKLEESGWTKTVGTAPKVHAFNTHLYSTFQSKGYNGVRRWAMRAKLGGKRLLDTEEILIPINDCAHWTLLVISGKDRTIRYYDSLGGGHKKYTDFALQYLAKELGNDFKENEWKVEKSWSQQQNNSNDCGVFVCMNGLALITGKHPSKAFETKDMPLAREMVAGILLGMQL
ncbi:MAG: Alpha-1,3-mannosyltransferase-like protein [Alyxoria varia]|nr:MAG: Alpha-1,3-mannosyltransferase-like protein [Alyxoria varia]